MAADYATTLIRLLKKHKVGLGLEAARKLLAVVDSESHTESEMTQLTEITSAISTRVHASTISPTP